jgi:hypothetical protein
MLHAHSYNTDVTASETGSIIKRHTHGTIIQKATNLNLLQRAAMQKKKKGGAALH